MFRVHSSSSNIVRKKGWENLQFYDKHKLTEVHQNPDRAVSTQKENEAVINFMDTICGHSSIGKLVNPCWVPTFLVDDPSRNHTPLPMEAEKLMEFPCPNRTATTMKTTFSGAVLVL